MNNKEKQVFGKTLTEKEIKRVQDEREIQEKTIDKNNPIAHKLASLSDAAYNQFLQQLGSVDKLLFSIIVSKKKIDVNTKDILSGKTNQKFSVGVWQGENKTVEDLKADNILNNSALFEGLESLRQVLTNLFFSHVGSVRLGDREVYFDENVFNKFVENISNKLKKIGVELFFERQKQILKDN